MSYQLPPHPHWQWAPVVSAQGPEAEGAKSLRLAWVTRGCLEKETPPLSRGPRSTEALTPVHVAAVWGCRDALELLLSRGGDPTLRDQVGIPCSAAREAGVRVEEDGPWAPPAEMTVSVQDGLRPLDWALQQGHHDCARLLRELDTPTRTRKETLEPAGEQNPGGARNLSPGCITSGISSTCPFAICQSLSIISQSSYHLTFICHLSCLYHLFISVYLSD